MEKPAVLSIVRRFEVREDLRVYLKQDHKHIIQNSLKWVGEKKHH